MGVSATHFPGCYHLTFPSLAGFEISFPNRVIQNICKTAETTEETLDHILCDQVLPRLIAHTDTLVLHGGGVDIEGKAIAIMAHTGQGKSTLSASLWSAGHTLLGDDALIVGADDDRPTIRAVYPSLRLLPDSAGHLFGNTTEIKTIAHYSDKRHLSVDGSDATAPLAMLVFLAPSKPNISLRRMSVAEACMSIITNSFALDPTDKSWAAANMQRASALAAAVPAYAVTYPRDYAALPDVHAAILDKLSTIAEVS